MGNSREYHIENLPKWILTVSISPIAILMLILMAFGSLLRFFFKASLLFIIVTIHTPFALMYNTSILVFGRAVSFQDLGTCFQNLGTCFQNLDTCFQNLHTCFQNLNTCFQNSSNKISIDPRASVGIEIQMIVSDFFKVVAGELLLVVSAGIITFYTAPLKVFYISLAIALAAIFHKWLNSNCLSKTALSCLCDGYGLNSLMFLFSFIGFFNIGYHPVAKCSFVAKQAFIFVKGDPNQSNEESGQVLEYKIFSNTQIHFEDKNEEIFEKASHHQSEGKGHSVTKSKQRSIDFMQWNAFERGLFQLNPRIDFIERSDGKYILMSSMVLTFFDKERCKYPVERLELPEDYSKTNQLYNFLDTLSKEDGFVTDKMRGRYEHSFTLLQIVEGVEENDGYKIVEPIDEVFVVAGCNDKEE